MEIFQSVQVIVELSVRIGLELLVAFYVGILIGKALLGKH